MAYIYEFLISKCCFVLVGIPFLKNQKIRHLIILGAGEGEQKAKILIHHKIKYSRVIY
jgi:hypothetical protein